MLTTHITHPSAHHFPITTPASDIWN